MAGKKDLSSKKSFDRTFLEKYNLEEVKLVKTEWFKNKICEILARAL